MESKDDFAKLNGLKTKQKLLTERLEAKKAKIKELQNTLENKTYVHREAYEFFDFLGFTNKTTKEEIISLLGEPDEYVYKHKSVYLDYKCLSFRFLEESSFLFSIMLLAFVMDFKDELNNMGLYDYRVDFIGKSKKEILELFGTPSNDNSYSYQYLYHNAYVIFDFGEGKSGEECDEISVQYLQNKNESLSHKKTKTIAQNQNLKNSEHYYTKETTKLNTENLQLIQKLEQCENQIKELVNAIQINSNKYSRREACELFDLLGFTEKTTKEDIINRIGKPSSWACTEEDINFTMMIYGDDLFFMYYKNNHFLMSTEISSHINNDTTKKYLKSLGIDDSRINEFLGKSKSEILKTFGTPAHNYSYITYPYDGFEVSFWFGGDNKDKMSIRVEYFSNYED